MALAIRDVMDTDVPVVYTADSTQRVIEIMREHDLSGVPVVNDGGRCVGIITEEDLILSGENEDLHLPHYFQLFGGFIFLERFSHFEERLRKAVASTAGDLMTEDPVTIGPDATVDEAARVIAQRKHNRLPVVEHGRLVGVVTRVDVLEALTRA
jgi:CBS domain-containing protein